MGENAERRATPLIALTRKTAVIALLTIVAAAAALWPLIARAMEKPQDVTALVHSADPSGTALVAPPRVIEVKPQAVASVGCGIKSGDYSQYRAMVVAEFGADAPVMIDIADAESNFDPSAKNCGSTATGIFQILKGTWEGAECTGSRTDPRDNIRCARIIYEDSGTTPWNSSSHAW